LLTFLHTRYNKLLRATAQLASSPSLIEIFEFANDRKERKREKHKASFLYALHVGALLRDVGHERHRR
jgi:hypothetical protein